MGIKNITNAGFTTQTTPVSLSRAGTSEGGFPVEYFICNSGSNSLVTNTTPQPIFPAITGNTITLEPDVFYLIEGQYFISTSNTMNITLSFSGTLGTEFSFMNYFYWGAAANAIATTQGSLSTLNFASVTITPPASAPSRIVRFKGIARNNGGTITPQITLGTAGVSTNIGTASWIKFTPISSINSTSIGPVS